MHFWWVGPLAVGLPYLSGVVAALCLIGGGWAAARRHWARLVGAAVLLVLIAVRFGPRLHAWTPAVATGEELSVMTFNVPNRSTDAATSGLVEVVRRADPHVLALQELPVRGGEAPRLPNGLRRLVSETTFGLPRAVAPTRSQQPVVGQVALDSLTVHFLPPDGASNARTRFTRTYFRWRGRPAVLYNLHLHTVGESKPWRMVQRYGGDWQAWRRSLRVYREGALRRAQQARRIRRMIAQEPHPVIVAGDFNSTRHQWVYQHIAQGLTDVVRGRVRGGTATFPAARPLVGIDHVLVGPAWRVAGAQVPSLGEAAAASDHRPVVAQIGWKRPPSGE
jgi:endonuclease/exonuclease/phosphatase family metal-dependent hydrolase